MNGGKESGGGDTEGQPSLAQVPIGWKRKLDSTGVIYISPSGSMLSSLEQVKSYLLTDGTCKCGLECPLILPKVFNFDPGAAVKQRTAEDVKADEDVTKLCIHKRKLIAVATLHKSMEMPHPPLGLTSPGGATGAASGASTRSATPRAIRNKSHEGLPGPGPAPDCKNPFKMMMASGGRPYPHPQDMSSAHHHQLQLQHHQQQQQELYAGYQRQRLASGEPGPKSPYRTAGHHHAGMLSPTSAGGSQVFGDSPLSPRTDPLGSPDAFVRAGGNPCAFQGGSSPSPIHGGNGRTPLSPPGVMLHGSPASQSSCVMAGRTNTPLSPPNTTKSPIMKKPMCNFPPGMDMPRAVFHHGKAQPAPHPSPTPPAMPPACILQKKPVSSEKDPLGILDPIPSKPVNLSPMANPNSSSGYPPGVHSQVPMMNVNIPPAIVPLPSNLPLPTVKPGPVGHGGHVQRTQPSAAAASTSISPSPVTSPVHMTAPPPHGRLESSPQRSRSSSTSSDHGSFAMPAGPQGPCGSLKVPPRSPRSSLGSPRPTLPSSPSSAKPDALHQYKDMPNQLLGGMGNSLGAQHNPMFPPPTSVASAGCGTGGGSGGGGVAGGGGGSNGQKSHPGLLGMPLNQILNQHNAASFPASSLLSAAAKAQLANQNKMGGGGGGAGGGGGGAGMGGNGGGAGGGTGIGGGLPCGKGVDGHSTLNPMLPPPNSAMMLNSVGSESGQSGRAALRDKLMAQQRDPLRKRKQPSGGSSGTGGGGGSSSVGSGHHESMMFNMLKPDMAGHPRMPGGPPPPSEQLRKGPRLANLPPNTSMAQLLQSMSSQNSHMAQNARMGPGPGLGPGPGPGLGPAQMHFGDGMMPGGPGHQNLQAQQRLHGPGDGMHGPSMGVPGQGPQMPYGGGMMNQIQASAMAGGGGIGPMGQGGQHSMGNPSMGHPGAHPQQLSYLQHQQQQQQQQQQGHSLSHGRANVSGMMLSSNDGSCAQAISEPGDGSSMNCMPNSQMGSLQAHVNPSSHMYPPQATLQQQHAQQQSLHPGLQGMHGCPPTFQAQHSYQENVYMDSSSSNSMACLYQNYQQAHPQMSSQSLSSLPEEDPGMQHALQQQYQAAHLQQQQQHPQPHLQQHQQLQLQHHQQQQQHQQMLRDLKAQNHEAMGSSGTAGPGACGLVPGASGGGGGSVVGGGNGGPESVDAIYRAVVDAASKGVHVTITTATSGGGTQSSPVTALSAMSAFTASIGEQHGQTGLQQHPGNVNASASTTTAAAMHGQQGEPSVTANPAARGGPGTRQPRPGRPRKNSEQGRSPPEAADAAAHEYFRSPSNGSGGGGTPRGQWDGLDTAGQTQWQGGPGGGGAGEEYLECSTQVRSSPAQLPSAVVDGGPHDVGLPSDRSASSYLEENFRYSGGGGAGGGQRTPINFKERLEQTVERCAHMNGGGGPPHPVPAGRGAYNDPLGPPRHELTGDDQSPSSSTSLEGPLAKDYGHYNGHYNGHCAPSPSDTRSLSSEEELRHPDSPAPELLHYRQRAFSMGELVWSQIKGFPPWPGKLAGAEEQLHKPAMQLSEPGKVEPEKLKTLTQDLEALERVAKMNRKSGKLNNHLEAAIQEAMSELDKISTVHQIPTRDRQVRLPKPKRRKISR